MASLDRNKGVKVSLPLLDTADKEYLTLDILVEGIGRDNSGSKFDLKGLVSQDVYLNGKSQPTASLASSLYSVLYSPSLGVKAWLVQSSFDSQGVLSLVKT